MKFALIAAFLLLASVATASPTSCELCVEFLGQAEGDLLDAIAQTELYACGDVCSLLPSKLEGVVCELLCDYVGINAFVDIVDQLDPDQILQCQDLGQCSKASGAASIANVEVSPHVGQAGDTFNFGMTVNVTQMTGAGEIALQITPPGADGFPFGDAVLNDGLPVGMQNFEFSLQAKPSEQESFGPGTYQVDFFVCEGQCGSTGKPHTKLLSSASSSFQIKQ